EEKVMEERVVDQEPARNSFAPPRSGRLHPHAENGVAHVAALAARVMTNGNGAQATDERIRLARLKGYEGDPCSECGQLTLIRSGACCKCDTCGASSGCS